MSYILDALKRADAERGQGRANRSMLESGTASVTPTERPPPPLHRNPVVWGALIAAVLLGSAAASVWQRLGTTAPALSPVAATAEPAEATINHTPDTLTTPAPAPAMASVEAPVEIPAPAPVAVPVLPIHSKAPPAPPPRLPASAETTPKDPTGQVQAPVAVSAPQAAPVSEPPAAPSALPALSAAARAALPDIQVSGSSYSANREHRMLIANGQVVKEGQELSPGLTLEVIGPRSAVFNHRGTRFNVNY